MERLPFNPKQFKAKMKLFYILYRGHVIGTTQAVSEDKAINNARYRYLLGGRCTYREFNEDFSVTEASVK